MKKTIIVHRFLFVFFISLRFSASAQTGTLNELYKSLIQREYVDPIFFPSHQIENRAHRSPSLRLRFGRSDKTINDDAFNKRWSDQINEKPIRSPSLRLRFGRRSDPLMLPLNRDSNQIPMINHEKHYIDPTENYNINTEIREEPLFQRGYSQSLQDYDDIVFNRIPSNKKFEDRRIFRSSSTRGRAMPSTNKQNNEVFENILNEIESNMNLDSRVERHPSLLELRSEDGTSIEKKPSKNKGIHQEKLLF